MVTLPEDLNEVGGIERRASWDRHLSAVDSFLELFVLGAAQEVSTEVGGEVDIRELVQV